MRKFLSASSVKQDEPRPPGWMHGMCQLFADLAQNYRLPPSDRANLLQNEQKSQPELLEITLPADLFSKASLVLSACRNCTKQNLTAQETCICTEFNQWTYAQIRAALLPTGFLL
jgi:hypothetical protein